MRIIAVNIRNNISKPPLLATQRAWKLNINRACKSDYVIGVASEDVYGYFRINGVMQDIQEPDRIAFDLIECTPNEIALINAAITSVNLKGIRTKYI